jgi:hypothetical protein
MADYFVDTSPLVKHHVDETGSKWVRSLIRANAMYQIYIARITAVEVFAAITRRQHSGDLSAARAATMDIHCSAACGRPEHSPPRGANSYARYTKSVHRQAEPSQLQSADEC